MQIQTTLFNAGPTETTALLAGKLDMAYVGPSPSVNAYIQSNGTGLRIVALAVGGILLFVLLNALRVVTMAAGGIYVGLSLFSSLHQWVGYAYYSVGYSLIILLHTRSRGGAEPKLGIGG